MTLTRHRWISRCWGRLAVAADIQYVYDQPSTQCTAVERAGVGRISSMIDSSGRTDYCYSPVGDLVRRVQVVEGRALVLRYAYAPSGRLQAMTSPELLT